VVIEMLRQSWEFHKLGAFSWETKSSLGVLEGNQDFCKYNESMEVHFLPFAEA